MWQECWVLTVPQSWQKKVHHTCADILVFSIYTAPEFLFIKVNSFFDFRALLT